MYIPERFHITDRELIERFVDEHGFGVLVSQNGAGPFATHVPLLVERRGEDSVLVGHVARANPHWRGFDGQAEALAIFRGPHAYVSPAWYATSPAVPTWNYAAVHAYGRPRVIEDESAVRAMLGRLVARHELERAAAPWSLAELPAEYLDKMVRAIVAFEMPIERVQAKFNLGQNR